MFSFWKDVVVVEINVEVFLFYFFIFIICVSMSLAFKPSLIERWRGTFKMQNTIVVRSMHREEHET